MPGALSLTDESITRVLAYFRTNRFDPDIILALRICVEHLVSPWELDDVFWKHVDMEELTLAVGERTLVLEDNTAHILKSQWEALTQTYGMEIDFGFGAFIAPPPCKDWYVFYGCEPMCISACLRSALTVACKELDLGPRSLLAFIRKGVPWRDAGVLLRLAN